jgi:hypothetical protein
MDERTKSDGNNAHDSFTDRLTGLPIIKENFLASCAVWKLTKTSTYFNNETQQALLSSQMT